MRAELKQAIDAYGFSAFALGNHFDPRYTQLNEKERQELTKAAKQLIALLARDDARIERLEDVVAVARRVPKFFPYQPVSSEILRALALLDDENAPGGG